MCRTSALFAVLVLAAPAAAQTVDATALTLLAGRPDPRDGTVHTVVPAIEDVWISARDLDVPGVEAARIIVSGWGELTLGEIGDADRLTGDLDLAFIEGRLLGRHLGLRLGRQLVAAGVARNLQLDGLDALVRAPLGLTLEVYGGAPVAPRFGSVHGRGVFGGRASWRPGAAVEAGVSFVQVFDDGLIARQELGADARVVLGDRFTLTGLAAWSPIEQRLAEATLRALWQARRDLEIGFEASRVAPDLFVSRASIFSVFAEETRDEAGATLYLRPTARLRLWGDGYVVHDDAGTGGRGGARTALALGDTQLGAEGRVVALPGRRTVQGRAYARQVLGEGLLATLECDAVWLDPAINLRDVSLSIAGTLGWDFRPGWKALVSALTGQTPLLEWRVEAMGKLVYTFRGRP
jgi:hypothetical protein